MPLHILIFKKKNPDEKLPVYTFSFYFDNVIISIPLLLHRGDLINSGETIQFPIVPPYFVSDDAVLGIQPILSIHDMSSPLKLKGEVEEMVMQFDKSELKKVVRFDPKTGGTTETDYNPSGSKYFITVEHGVELTKAEMIQLSTLIEKAFSE
ncbi:MAG: hypothetical protein QM764_20870 [Chitinophagaceae bacterium]